jgi:predicted unusual protein kinase regulating ubiquinone biosynthesis (AarF/ABC1/UbiB family)
MPDRAEPATRQDTAGVVADDRPAARIDRQRYRRITGFFGRMIAALVWWEVIVKRVAGERAVRRNRSTRLRHYARDFRALATGMGGVMIKLGQFISARVDVLPEEITSELAGLQDEVPPADLDGIRAIIGQELGPPDEIFAWFDSDVQAAASLGQVYRARLHGGEEVIVKVQRPGIEDLVATDLAALRVVARWAMRYRPIRKRADVPALLEEFARTLWEELDYLAEAANAERFGELFADTPGVYIPAVYHATTTRRVLTLEDVTTIKIMDYAAIDRAGVSREAVSRHLFDLYMTMIFEFGFFHADPHPGNLFVYPLPPEADDQLAISDGGDPFYIVFVDFGMVGRIADRVRAGLREALIGIATRDTKRVLRAYQMLDVLLPGADLERLEQVEQIMFDRVWGMDMRQMTRMAHSEMREMAYEFRDVMYEMPFQVPQDFIYLGRAVGILAGMCTGLDPDFNPWLAIAPYGQSLLEEELRSDPEAWLGEALDLVRVTLGLPRLADDVLSQARRGDLQVRIAPDRSLQRQIDRLERAVNRALAGLIFIGLVTAGTLAYVGGERGLGTAGLVGALLTLAIILLYRPSN